MHEILMLQKSLVMHVNAAVAPVASAGADGELSCSCRSVTPIRFFPINAEGIALSFSLNV